MEKLNAEQIAEIIKENFYPITKVIDYVEENVSRNKLNRILREIEKNSKLCRRCFSRLKKKNTITNLLIG